MLIQFALACQNPALSTLLSTVKRILTLIQIIAPIALIVSGSISFAALVGNPDAKNGVKRVFIKFIAAVVIFFVPVLINVLMAILGDDTNFSSCWQNANEKATPISAATNDNTNNNNKKSPINDPSSYEQGVPGAKAKTSN